MVIFRKIINFDVTKLIEKNFKKLQLRFDQAVQRLLVCNILYLFLDENLLNHTLKNQISSLIVNISENLRRSSIDNVIKCAFTHILTMFTNIKYLNFGESLRSDQRLSFYLSPPSVISSTLLELHVSLVYFSDCLYLLDGRFNQLHTLYVYIYEILSSYPERIEIIKQLNNFD